MEGLVKQLGGQPEVTPAQSLLLGTIRAKVITLLQISNYVSKQESIIDENTGQLIPVLARNYTSYSEALRRDLESLFQLRKKRTKKIPTIRDIVAGNDHH